MGYWGWRRLLAVCVSVWVVSCVPAHNTAPTAPPTQSPSVTLIARLPISPTPHTSPVESEQLPTVPAPTPITYTVQPGDTLLQIARRFSVELEDLQSFNGGIEPLSLQIGQQLIIPNAQFNAAGAPIRPTSTPLALPLHPPTCYPAPTGHVLCLGQVTNPFDHPIQRVNVLVRLFQSDGTLLTQGESVIEQAIIPPGLNAPYRLLVKADWRMLAGVSARIQTAERVEAASNTYTWLVIEDQSLEESVGHYTLKATLHNPSPDKAHLLRAVVILQDINGQITGYRVMPLDGILGTGEQMPFQMDVMSQSPDTTTSHSFYVEAVRVP
jgi:LysM repeat protein